MYFYINVLKFPVVCVYEVAFLCYNEHCTDRACTCLHIENNDMGDM